jgi:hypothetical protein
VACPCGLAGHIFLLLTSLSPLTNDIYWSHLSMISILKSPTGRTLRSSV